jgi:hypothetical protein
VLEWQGAGGRIASAIALLSSLYYQLISGSDPPWLAPELAVDETIADLRAGRDPLLEAAVADRR